VVDERTPLKEDDRPLQATRLPSSDVVDANFLDAFGDMLKLQHSLSTDYLDKHRFEAAMEKILNACGRKAARPGRCYPGHDITVDGVRWSLKTQGDAGIKDDSLYISKFMELGKGKWADMEDLHGLRDQFLEHMKSSGYDRIRPGFPGRVNSVVRMSGPAPRDRAARQG
jgi:type II restriction enzyme